MKKKLLLRIAAAIGGLVLVVGISVGALARTGNPSSSPTQAPLPVVTAPTQSSEDDATKTPEPTETETPEPKDTETHRSPEADDSDDQSEDDDQSATQTIRARTKRAGLDPGQLERLERFPRRFGAGRLAPVPKRSARLPRRAFRPWRVARTTSSGEEGVAVDEADAAHGDKGLGALVRVPSRHCSMSPTPAQDRTAQRAGEATVCSAPGSGGREDGGT